MLLYFVYHSCSSEDKETAEEEETEEVERLGLWSPHGLEPLQDRGTVVNAANTGGIGGEAGDIMF